MKILVGVKHVPDTETKIKIGATGDAIDESGVKWVVSPYDEFAIEEAIAIKEANGDGEVVLVCAGPGDAKSTLRQGLAMGADRAVLIEHVGFQYADALTRARAIAAIAEVESPDLVLVGKHGVGTDEMQTGPMVAELLGMPNVTAVAKLELGNGSFTAHREIEGAVEVHEGRLPAVLGIDKGINEPRYASLKGIMKAKKKPIDSRSPGDVGIDEAEFSEGKRVRWESIELPPPKQAGRMIEGDPEEQAREVARILREEVKVI